MAHTRMIRALLLSPWGCCQQPHRGRCGTAGMKASLQAALEVQGLTRVATKRGAVWCRPSQGHKKVLPDLFQEARVQALPAP